MVKKIFLVLSLILSLTWSGYPSLFAVSDDEAIQLGRKAHQEILKQYGVWKDQKQQERVNRLGRSLARFSNRPEIRYHFFLLNSNILNAMATPDGSIHVTRGLASRFPDDELRFVLGHEITHVEKRHTKQLLERNMTAQAGGNLLLILLGNKSPAARIGVQGAGFWLAMKYSREFEYQADEGGMELLSKGGWDPETGPKALKHLFQLSKQSPNLLSQYFGSHPLPAERILHAEEFARKLK